MRGTGNVKKWAFLRIDWDYLIQNGPFEINRAELHMMNSTELVEILQLLGLRVSRNNSIDELRSYVELIRRGVGVSANNNADMLRNKLICLYESTGRRAYDQLPPYCEFKCYEHPDPVVVHCYLLQRENIIEFLENKGD